MSTPRKILLFSLSLKKGGAENQLIKLAVFLKNIAGFEVSVVYFVDGNDFESTLYKHRIPYNRMSITQITGIINFLKFVNKYKPDLVIAFMFGASIIARFLKIFFKIPIITSVRNNEISERYRLLYRLTYKLDDATTFNSNYALEKFIKRKLTSSKRSFLINNAVSFSHPNDSEISTNAVENNNTLTLLSIAHFRPQKDYHTLFKAISLLKKNKICVKLYVLGHLFNQTWPYEVIKRLQIDANVIIVGFTDDIKRYLEIADVVVLSSLWEGTPNAVLEAMAFGLPIIASDIPGVSDLINKSKGGLLVEGQNSQSLADAIVEIYNTSPEERADMGARGRKYVFDNFEENAVYSTWLDLIEEVLSKSKWGR